MSTYSRRRESTPGDAPWWFWHFLTTTVAIWLGIVLGGVSLGYLLKEYVRGALAAPPAKQGAR